ncbi:MAG: metal-dependent transcriptional regulator [Methanomicrobia archaeon]|nr:metal-dependent transcriptional regulator [Methanomicrobia archaeon]
MLSRKVEDYLEAILNITEEKGHTRTKDVAVALDIKPPSVVEMLKRLHDRGLVEYRRYEGVRLTARGTEVAQVVKERHETIRAFLEILRVPKKIADEDACIIEHELRPETIRQLKNFVRFMTSAPEYPQWLEQFETFCITEKHPRDVAKRAAKVSGSRGQVKQV